MLEAWPDDLSTCRCMQSNVTIVFASRTSLENSCSRLQARRLYRSTRAKGGALCTSSLGRPGEGVLLHSGVCTLLLMLPELGMGAPA